MYIYVYVYFYSEHLKVARHLFYQYNLLTSDYNYYPVQPTAWFVYGPFVLVNVKIFLINIFVTFSITLSLSHMTQTLCRHGK